MDEKILFFEKKIVEEKFWKDKILAQKTLKEKSFFEDIKKNYLESKKEVSNLLDLYQLASAENNKIVINVCIKAADLQFLNYLLVM